jgi:hypothetical protein
MVEVTSVTNPLVQHAVVCCRNWGQIYKVNFKNLKQNFTMSFNARIEIKLALIN